MESRLSEEAKKLLDRYIELFNEWKDRMGNETELSDECLLTIALLDSITYMHIVLDK